MLPQENLVPKQDHDTLNNYEDDVEGEVAEDDTDGEEIFGPGGDPVEDVEEHEINKEQERIIDNNDSEELEQVAEAPEQEDDQAERMIDKLIETFEECVLPEGKQALGDLNDDKIYESGNWLWPTRDQGQPDGPTYAQLCQKVQHFKILGANQVPMRGPEKIGMRCNQKLMTRHRKSRLKQMTS